MFVGLGVASDETEGTDRAAATTPPALQAIDADLTPAGVVEAQMRGLSAWRQDPEAAARVFDLASPANRAVTGPLEKFRGLVESEPYVALVDNDGWAVGSAVERDGVAVVLVTLVSDTGALRAYRFYLSRLPNQPGGRWRTDAVFSLQLPPGGADPPRDSRI